MSYSQVKSISPRVTALEKTKGAVVTSTVAVLLGALLLRVGGRAALMSILGLDFVADSGIGDQIDQVKLNTIKEKGRARRK